MTARTLPLLRELDRRRHDGIDVRLLWRAHDDRCLVEVSDDKTGEEFSLVVEPYESALDVFHHPFAYRALRERDDMAVAA